MTSNANLVHEMIYYRSSAGDHPGDDLEGFELDHFRSLKLKRMGSLKMKEQIKSLTFRPNLVSIFSKSGPYCRALQWDGPARTRTQWDLRGHGLGLESVSSCLKFKTEFSNLIADNYQYNRASITSLKGTKLSLQYSAACFKQLQAAAKHRIVSVIDMNHTVWLILEKYKIL